MQRAKSVSCRFPGSVRFCKPRLFSCGFLTPFGSYSPSSPSSRGSPELCLMFGRGLCICSHHLLGEASGMTVGLGPIYENIRLSLGIISLTFFFFFSFFGSCLVLSYVSRVSCLWNLVLKGGWSSSQGMGLQLTPSLIGHSHNFCPRTQDKL